MPFERTYNSQDARWGIWKIEEDESSLAMEVPSEQIPATLTNPFKRLEFLAGRVLIKSLLESWHMAYQGLEKDVYGKPFLSGSSTHISLTHSYPYVAAVVDKRKNAGIDLEQPKDKLLGIAPRVLSPGELQDAGHDVTKHCIYWCAKETLVKIYGKKGLTLAKNIQIEPFSVNRSGRLIGRILATDIETAIPLAYIVDDNFVMVVSD